MYSTQTLQIDTSSLLKILKAGNPLLGGMLEVVATEISNLKS